MDAAWYWPWIYIFTLTWPTLQSYNCVELSDDLLLSIPHDMKLILNFDRKKKIPKMSNCSFNVLLLLWPLCTYVIGGNLYGNVKSHLLDNPKHPTVTHMYRTRHTPPSHYGTTASFLYVCIHNWANRQNHMSEILWDMSEGDTQSVGSRHLWFTGRNKWQLF